MAEDIFDVVDDFDRVVGQASRKEVHAMKWLHRAVHIFVFNRKGELFLQKRSLNKDSHPGKWDSSCSGHVDSGEDYRAAAARELKEELGLEIPRARLESLEYIRASPATDQEFVEVFKVSHEGPFQLNLEEISEGRFLKPDALKSAVAQKPDEFATAFKTILSRLSAKGLW